MMPEKKKYDYAIIGQGLAGSCLAWQLIKRGKKIRVYDEPSNNQSSSVAAGLFNPVAGQWMVKTWMADIIFPYLKQLYTEVETEVGRKLLFESPLYRPFSSFEEQNEWMGRTVGDTLKGYVEFVFTSSKFGNDVNDSFGGLLLSQCGYVDVQSFLAGIRNKLISIESYVNKKLDESKLSFSGGKITYDDCEFGSIVFCDGLGSMHSRYFHWLPFRPLKGETMDIKIREDLGRIYNRGVYIVPTNEAERYKVGATYNREPVAGISEMGQAELEQKLNDLLRIPYEIISRNWGIRPAIDDRRPVLGEHPEHKNVLIFNGLGTKGVSLAPYFSLQMVDWMEGRLELTKEANISRYKSLYSRSLA